MRVRSEVDVPVSILIWSSVALVLFSLVLIPSEGRVLSVLVGLPVAAGLAWIYFGTYYELKPDHLYCRSGPFVERIPYDRIKSIALKNSMASSMALSRRRIEIRQHGKNYVAGTTLVSPVKREEFMRELISRCSNLQG